MSIPSGRDRGGAATPPAGSGTTRERREVPAVAKLAGFAVILAAVFALTLLVGGQIVPVGEPAAAEHGTDHSNTEDLMPDEMEDGMSDGASGHGGHGSSGSDGEAAAEAGLPGGLQISEGGYTLVLDRTVVAAGDRTVSFRVEGPDGEAVRDYEIEHEKELHFIAVRRDFTGFQHVHPDRAGDGTWSTRLDLTGGTWRLFADFTAAPTGGEDPQPLTLGTDLAVTGPTGPLAEGGPAVRRVDTVDGYRVEMTGSLDAGEDSELSFAVTRNGSPVADLQPYLGARGHLVALREGDLAYLHVHPTDEADAVGNEVGFGTTVPSVGGYRLYLDFRVDGVVRTASFALATDGGSAGEGAAESDDPGGDEENDHTD